MANLTAGETRPAAIGNEQHAGVAIVGHIDSKGLTDDLRGNIGGTWNHCGSRRIPRRADGGFCSQNDLRRQDVGNGFILLLSAQLAPISKALAPGQCLVPSHWRRDAILLG